MFCSDLTARSDLEICVVSFRCRIIICSLWAGFARGERRNTRGVYISFTYPLLFYCAYIRWNKIYGENLKNFRLNYYFWKSSNIIFGEKVRKIKYFRWLFCLKLFSEWLQKIYCSIMSLTISFANVKHQFGRIQGINNLRKVETLVFKSMLADIFTWWMRVSFSFYCTINWFKTVIRWNESDLNIFYWLIGSFYGIMAWLFVY